jgi:hypothetical protein
MDSTLFLQGSAQASLRVRLITLTMNSSPADRCRRQRLCGVASYGQQDSGTWLEAGSIVAGKYTLESCPMDALSHS